MVPLFHLMQTCCLHGLYIRLWAHFAGWTPAEVSGVCLLQVRSRGWFSFCSGKEIWMKTTRPQKLDSIENVRGSQAGRSLRTATGDRCDESRIFFLPPTSTVTGWRITKEQVMEAGTFAAWTRSGKDAESQHLNSCNSALKFGNL